MRIPAIRPLLVAHTHIVGAKGLANTVNLKTDMIDSSFSSHVTTSKVANPLPFEAFHNTDQQTEGVPVVASTLNNR